MARYSAFQIEIQLFTSQLQSKLQTSKILRPLTSKDQTYLLLHIYPSNPLRFHNSSPWYHSSTLLQFLSSKLPRVQSYISFRASFNGIFIPSILSKFLTDQLLWAVKPKPLYFTILIYQNQRKDLNNSVLSLSVHSFNSQNASFFKNKTNKLR